MTKDDIICMAREAGLFTHKEVQPEILAFYNLAAAAEREECAQVIDDFGDEWMCGSHQLSKIIRARGNT
jgi:hypothetical protein